jgi:hypothetical protein
MKFHLFIDNFRGFSRTFVPISEVSFLVGENSTGKTSVLGLLKLFMNPHSLLMAQDFGDEGVDFGNFPDMVSAHSKNQRRFDIGIIYESSKKKGDLPIFGYILTYAENKGLPKLAKCTFFLKTDQISLNYVGRKVWVKATKHPTLPTFEYIKEIFLSELGSEIGKDSSYEKLITPSGLHGDVPPFFALSFARNQLKRDTEKERVKEKEDFLFYPEIFASIPQLCWVAPIRTKPKRTYDVLTHEFSPEGEHTPYLLRGILRSKSQSTRFRTAICKAGKATGLFQDVKIRNFGSGATAPFEVDIVLDGKGLNVNTVGYGVSQSLPVLVELIARRKGSWFAIQQPEVHLHPRAQAAFGDVLFEMASKEEKCFVIETHSDFLMDRFRLNYKTSHIRNPESQILFFERKDEHNLVTPLLIGESGELPEDQPETYRDFFIHEQMNMLGI